MNEYLNETGLDDAQRNATRMLFLARKSIFVHCMKLKHKCVKMNGLCQLVVMIANGCYGN
jgi:hypothetical protein